ncbi:hypothetical protein PIGHUM_04457 [Pigmentiphaga humi]|uniref:MmcB family DNA repair protein n=1 Tax=Pigmentiphaga humi TaxID=2478468 RepID=A0A3P4B9G6_9BURK|nr:hypothetical protein [Pigmentiphaga humi]VCU72358.1 hypothetical protein PIGHUM_04457 [Pigmentiphaga humi]
MTHDELALDLARHLRERTGRIVWTDMQLGPVGSPRPDVYSIEPSYTKFRPIAYEVKVSQSDYRRDITAGKWQTYLPFAAGVVFAAPAGLVERSSLPEGCGLIVRNADGWRTVKAPTLRAIETLPHSAWVKLFIDGMGREADRLIRESRPGLSDEWMARRTVGKKLGSEVSQILVERGYAESRYALETKRLCDAADGMTEEVREHERRIRERVERDAAEIDKVRAELAQALGLPANSSVRSIRAAAESQSYRLSKDGEIQELRHALSMAQRALTGGLSVPALATDGGQTA